MKKQNLKSLKLNKRLVSNLKRQEVKGGTASGNNGCASSLIPVECNFGCPTVENVCPSLAC